ncbi:pyridoxamine 5'-phosphate oxidase family protein [Nocardiopsis trehalosi]|jgi:hypothetical protein|uniref:pyridoxamine 5'-phosphate oxidase family protein n=1 Tax=Nocardiopsis trehalosi TaxID=109329 RepID=UPI000830A2E0|nr:pyridoxamine 5'-phosphate oxidase family protein [Nocardiopsis trehalosi]
MTVKDTTAVSWAEFAAAEPAFAAAVRARFTAAKHHVLATLRADGAPRVSGTEVDYQRGHLLLGSMPQARKALDLRRDGRYALHASTADETLADGDAKVSGVAVEVVDPDEIERHRTPGTPPGPFHLFRLLLTDVVLTVVDGDRLVIRHWRPGAGLTETSRT